MGYGYHGAGTLYTLPLALQVVGITTHNQSGGESVCQMIFYRYQLYGKPGMLCLKR